MPIELKERTEVYTKSFEPDVRIRADNTVDQLREILHNKESAVLLALPAFHREQRIFGKVENQKRESFVRNVAFDVSSFGQVPNAEETALVAFNALKQIEFILHWDFIDNLPYPVKGWKDPETAISLRENIISSTVWRNLNPDKFYPQYDLATNLTYQIKGNMHYLFLYGPYTPKNEPISESYEDEWLKKRVRRLGSPSAELEYINREEQTEFNRLISQVSPLLLHYISTLSIRTTTYRNDIIPAESERIAVFSRFNSGLPEIMSVIDKLPLLQKKCILYYFGFLGNNLSQKKWTADGGISTTLFKYTIHKVFNTFEEYLPKPDCLLHSISDIVKSCSDYQVIKSSLGRAQTESSRTLKIVQLTQNNFSQGTFTETEFRVINFVSNYYREQNTTPSYTEISKCLNLTRTTIDGLFSRLFLIDLSKDRFATKEDCIKADSSHYRAIRWYKNHLHDPNLSLLLSSLTETQRRVFLLSVTLEGNYYRTPKQIVDVLKPNNNLEKIHEYYRGIINTCMKKINTQASKSLRQRG